MDRQIRNRQITFGGLRVEDLFGCSGVPHKSVWRSSETVVDPDRPIVTVVECAGAEAENANGTITDNGVNAFAPLIEIIVDTRPGPGPGPTKFVIATDNSNSKLHPVIIAPISPDPVAVTAELLPESPAAPDVSKVSKRKIKKRNQTPDSKTTVEAALIEQEGPAISAASHAMLVECEADNLVSPIEVEQKDAVELTTVPEHSTPDRGDIYTVESEPTTEQSSVKPMANGVHISHAALSSPMPAASPAVTPGSEIPAPVSAPVSAWAKPVRSWAAVLRPPGAPEARVVHIAPSQPQSSNASTVPSRVASPAIANATVAAAATGTATPGRAKSPGVQTSITVKQALEHIHIRYRRRSFAKSAPAAHSSVATNGVSDSWDTPLPRGMINNGNTCYMNAILQPLAHLPPFYHLFRDLASQAGHLIGSYSASETFPLIQAMMLFVNEFDTDSSQSTTPPRQPSPPGKAFSPVKPLSRRGSQHQARHPRRTSMRAASPPRPALPETLKAHAEDSLDGPEAPFTPGYVYHALRRRNKFDSLRGRQEDAEEFLGALLDTLHEEFSLGARGSDTAEPPNESGDWLEMGRNKRAMTTREVGEVQSSPIREIFGGQLRSIVRRHVVSGGGGSSAPQVKDSATLEPFHALHLDISPAGVHGIEDALHLLTQPEDIDGGRETQKRVLVERWPPVLVLHLKRFVYDPEVGVRKVRRPVAYGTSLRVDPTWTAKKRAPGVRTGATSNTALPDYRLFAVVYHHGVEATGGHYTCDVLTQSTRGAGAWGAQGRWMRMDDTSLRDVSPSDVISMVPPGASAAAEWPAASLTDRATGTSGGDAYLLVYADARAFAP